jgi:hypothetical protein
VEAAVKARPPEEAEAEGLGAEAQQPAEAAEAATKARPLEAAEEEALEAAFR